MSRSVESLKNARKTRKERRKRNEDLDKFMRNPGSGFVTYTSAAKKHHLQNDYNTNRVSLFSRFLDRRPDRKMHIGSFINLDNITEAKIRLRKMLSETNDHDNRSYGHENGIMLYRLSGPSRKLSSREFSHWIDHNDFEDFVEQKRVRRRQTIKYEFIFTNINVTIIVDRFPDPDNDDIIDEKSVEEISRLLTQ